MTDFGDDDGVGRRVPMLSPLRGDKVSRAQGRVMLEKEPFEEWSSDDNEARETGNDVLSGDTPLDDS